MHLHVVDVHTATHPHTFGNFDKEFFSEDSLHGYVAGVHTAAHPQTCEKFDKECYSKDSLQRHEANVRDQLVVSREPVLENRKSEYEDVNPKTCEKC